MKNHVGPAGYLFILVSVVTQSLSWPFPPHSLPHRCKRVFISLISLHLLWPLRAVFEYRLCGLFQEFSTVKVSSIHRIGSTGALTVVHFFFSSRCRQQFEENIFKKKKTLTFTEVLETWSEKLYFPKKYYSDEINVKKKIVSRPKYSSYLHLSELTDKLIKISEPVAWRHCYLCPLNIDSYFLWSGLK